MNDDVKRNGEPLAWAVRAEVGQMSVAACWTDEEIALEAMNPATVALMSNRDAAHDVSREMNAMLKARAAAAALWSPARIPSAKKAFCGRCGDPFYVSAGFRNVCRPCRSELVKEGIANRPRAMMPIEEEPHVH